MSIIELGNLTLDAPPPPAPRQRWISPQWRRAVQIVVGALLALLVLAGSMVAARPTLPLIAALPIRPQSRIMIAGDRLYAIGQVAGHSEISAYSLPAGDRLWNTRVALPGGPAVLTSNPAALVVRVVGDVSATAIAVLDPVTGVRLWSDTSISAALDAGDRQYLLDTGGTQLRAVDTRTGKTLWSAAMSPQCQVQMAGPNRLAEFCPSTSALHLVNVDTGMWTVSRTVTTGVARPDGGVGLEDLHLLKAQLFGLGGILLISHDDYPQPTVDAYSATDLSTVWSGVTTSASAYFSQCGSAICSDDGTSHAVIDASNGMHMSQRVPARSSRLAAPPPTGHPGTLVVVPADDQPSPVSTPTGMVATFVNPAADQATVPVGAGAAGLTWIAVQAAGTVVPVVEPLELITGVRVDSCVAISAYVACEMPSGLLDLWRLP